MIKNFKHLLELAKEKESNKIAVVAADDIEILDVIASRFYISR